jgi:trans-aconitate methyltransferase
VSSNDTLVGTLESIAGRYNPSDPTTHFDYWLKRLEAMVLEQWLIGERVVELGCATGELTSLLRPLVSGTYTVVEGSTKNIETARPKVTDVEFLHSLWEDYSPPPGGVSDIVLFGSLEHIADPVTLLARCPSWLGPGGRIHVMVPNGLSFHRLVGVELGLQPDPLTLTEADAAQGHMRNYTIDLLGEHARSAGLRVRHWQGIFLKVLANSQMLSWEWPLIRAMHEVGQRIPEHCAELFAVLSTD